MEQRQWTIESQVHVHIVQLFAVEQWRPNLVSVTTVFAKDFPLEGDLEIEFLKRRMSYLVELFQISSEIQSFQIPQTCFTIGKQDKPRIGTGLNPLLRFKSVVTFDWPTQKIELFGT